MGTCSSSSAPREPPDALPTFHNIKKEAGDIFHFHFSGHGGLLRATVGSPAGRTLDASLLTADFCIDKSALRGWELNEWLQRLHQKNVRLIVVLDSCYSGGSWRNDRRGRTPMGWYDGCDVQPDSISEPLPSLEAPTHRGAALPETWSINPAGFTLMTACKSDELAKETKVNGKSYGAFTHTLIKLLEESHPRLVPYTCRVLCNKIVQELGSQGQDPQVFGRDRLAFLDDYEPAIFNPIIATVEGDDIVLPMGRAHGVYLNTEFKYFPGLHDVVFRVDDVSDWKCRATRITGSLPNPDDVTVEVAPWRWGMRTGRFQVYVDMSLGDDFQAALYRRLGEMLAGSIEVVEFDIKSTPKKAQFKLTRCGVDGIKIHGQPSLLGYTDSVQGLDLRARIDCRIAERCAAALAHLARFKQVLYDVRKEASQNPPPFTWSVDKTGNPNDTAPEMKFTFTNTGGSLVNLTVLSLNPGFGIQRIWPADMPHTLVAEGATTTFTFNFEFHEEILKTEAPKVSPQREIIRVIVTSGEGRSWDCLELPTLWQTDRVEAARVVPTRSVWVWTGTSSWWIMDKEHVVQPPPTSG
ncbi:hypothetical protein FQN49_006810 [Arthroderma sp. PD_2]|nr:hypothetical protein FQN49_006810 [Arthroderma sp. PD_2]